MSSLDINNTLKFKHVISTRILQGRAYHLGKAELWAPRRVQMSSVEEEGGRQSNWR